MQGIRKQFPALTHSIYANTAATGLLSQSLVEWRQEHDLDYLIGGSTAKMEQAGIIATTKTIVANFFGCQRESVALIQNFTLGLNILVLCKFCPVEYCNKGTVTVTIENPDMQCDLNRTGLLCGACAANHSLMLGSSQCQVCPNTYLALLFPFAAAGVALVVFLTSLRLTVAAGTLNSIILYANILQVKRSLFFLPTTTNVLTVFLAWMNFDLGFQTCFFDGLDAYALTWLQFAFPLYVWFMIGLMIFISRYSITVSKLIGSNPVAVLATLLLMSYTKILKIIIEVYSYENLDYPDNKIVPVWSKDANVPYLESRHLFLIVVVSLVLVFLFLPYTLLLLLGHKLYHFTGKKHWRWLNRLKPCTAGLLLRPIQEPHSLLDWLPATSSLCSLHCILHHQCKKQSFNNYANFCCHWFYHWPL